DVLNLAEFHELTGAAGQPLHDAVFERAQLRQIDPGFAELHAPAARLARFVDQLRDVQQRLRWNAAAVDTDAAGIDFGIDERGGEAEIRREKCSRVPAGPAAHDHQLG